MDAALQSTSTLLKALCDPALYDHDVLGFELLQTHISWILLTGLYAYKIKKPVNFGFVDFSTLEKRAYCCHEEHRLNQRLAPSIYRDVISIHGDVQRPSLTPVGRPIEYAVRMRQFDRRYVLTELVQRGELEPAHVDELASMLAAFHDSLVAAPGDSRFGLADVVHHWVDDNFERIGPLLEGQRARLDALRARTKAAGHDLEPELGFRREHGFVRECHGDLHLGNIVLLDGQVTAFDCIEFNPGLRWMDVMSEVAFVLMDLEQRGHRDLAYRFLDRYLQSTGDFRGARVLPYYLGYRAMVRAKVSLLCRDQGGLAPSAQARMQCDYDAYVELAERYVQGREPMLLITHGLSGSGKSTLSAALLEIWGAIRVRSDVERKRLFGIEPEAPSGSHRGEGIYSREAGARVYRHLAQLARHVVSGGIPVIVDATFLKSQQRRVFRDLARELGVPFRILCLEAPADLLRQRTRSRWQDGERVSEADEAVLEAQLASVQPLDAGERADAVVVDAARAFDPGAVLRRLRVRGAGAAW
jgi:aminoglycoside phosphotransferase family enzyme/predicted kinase